MERSAADRQVPALELRGVVKRFGATVALDAADLVVRQGTVHALLGENGAGKSTAMRIAYGLLAADAGDVRLFGAGGTRNSVASAVAAGVGMVHQHLSLVPTLTAAENVALGGRGLYRPSAARSLVKQVSEASGLSVSPDDLVRDLSVVEQQRLEIVKALARNARLLILDEPTAALAPSEADELLRWIRSFAGSGGSVVLVTHKLREALAVADDVTVLRRGRVVHAGTASATSEDQLARAMFPDAAATAPMESPAKGERVARLAGVAIADSRGALRLRSASLEVFRHEIVGVAAVEGSGHRDLLAALSGLRKATRGDVSLPTRISVVPADRVRDAIVPDFSIAENVALHGLAGRRGLMPWGEIAARARILIERFGIVAPSPRALARTLSGGNQQRLVIARELEHEVDLVVADNPTRGLDLRATTFVHEQLRAAAARGAGVVVHSSDVDEILLLASRVVVVFHGEVREAGLDRGTIGRAMLGAPEHVA